MKNQRSNIIVCTLLLLFLSFAMLGSANATVFSSNFLKNLSLLADPDEIYNHNNPKMTVSDQFVHVLWWAAKKDWSVNVIFYIRSTDGGKTFGTAQKLAEGRCENFSNEWNNFQADGPYIHVFYTCASQGSLIYLRSDDYGVTFKPKEVFSTGSYTPTDVYLTSGAGNLAIAWSKPLYSALHTDLICSYSTDGGATFHHTTIAAISDKYSAGVADIVRSGNYLYILAWTQDLNSWGTASRLLLYASWDGGATFKPPVRVTVPASDGNPYVLKIQSANYSPNLFAEGNTVNIVWHNNDGPPTDYYWYAPTLRTCRSTDGGLTLTSPITLHTYPVGYDSSPTFGLETIAGKGSNLYITTVLEAPLSTDKPAGNYVWRSTDSGTSWGAAKLIAPGGWWPHIGVDPTDSSSIHLTNSWYFQSLDAGDTFTGGVNPNVDAGDWNDPNMSISNDGVVHSCGSHGGAYNGHIYYRRIAPEPDPGSLNQALSLAKTSSTRHDNIQIPAFSNINFSTQMTVEFWVQRTSDNWPYFQYMVSKNRTSSNYGSYMIGAWSDFQLYGRLVTEQTDTNGGTFMGTGITLPRDTWTHVAMTYDASLSANNWKMYVNGLLANQMDMKGAILNETGFSPLVIGGRPDVPETGSMKIDELRLWNRPLSEGEIAQNMFRTLTGGENGLSAYYNFNDTFKELTGKGFDAMPMYWETFVPSTIPTPTPGLLAASFADSGLWIYNSGTAAWLQVSSTNPENMIYSGSTLYVDFGASYGLYRRDDAAWAQLTTANPENMVASGLALYADFGASGLYKFDGAAWAQLTTANPENMVASGSLLYANFGASGLYKFDGAAWAQLTTANPENMVASGSSLYADFGALGLYRWDGTAWSQLTSANPENMVASDSAFYVDFGAAYGLYKWSGAAWSQLTLANAEIMVTSGSTLYVNFGAAYGIYKWDGAAWAQLTPTNPENMVASGSMLYVDFGAAYGFYKWDGSSWSQLTGSNPDKMAVSN